MSWGSWGSRSLIHLSAMSIGGWSSRECDHGGAGLHAGDLLPAVTLDSGQMRDNKGAALPLCFPALFILTLMLDTCQSCFLTWM